MPLPVVKELQIPNFLDGLNTIQDSTQIKDTECQNLNNLEVRPINYSSDYDGSAGISTLALTARGSYRNLHTDLLPYFPRNLIEFTTVSLGTTFFSQINDYDSPNGDASYVYTTSTTAPIIFGLPAITLSPVPAPASSINILFTARVRQHNSSGGVMKAALRVNGINYIDNGGLAARTLTANWVDEVAGTPMNDNNPNTGLAWTIADVEGTGPNPLQGIGVTLDSGAGLDLSSIKMVINWTRAGKAHSLTVVPITDTLTTSWTIFTVAGQRWLVTGGYDQTANAFKVNRLLDGTTITVLHNSQTAGGVFAPHDTGRVSFFNYNQYLFYTDGNFPWRKWDGVTDSASGYTTVTKTAVIHKDRAWYGNDVTNTLSNYVYYSSVGLPETVNPLNFFRIGSQSDPIVSLIDMQDHLLIIKQKSTWALYVSADLTNSLLIRKNRAKGSPAPLGSIWTDNGVMLFTANSGTQLLLNNDYAGKGFQPVFVSVYNLLRGTIFDNNLAFGYIQDQVWLAHNGTEPYDTVPRTFIYDTPSGNVYKNTLALSCFLTDASSNTYNGWPKACLQAGIIIEFDHVNDASESSVLTYMRTKDFTFDKLPNRKNLSYIVLDVVIPDLINNLTINTWGDNVIQETFTKIATQVGYNRYYFPCRPDLSRGHKISVDISFPQTYADLAINKRFCILSMTIGYSVEERVGT